MTGTRNLRIEQCDLGRVRTEHMITIGHRNAQHVRSHITGTRSTVERHIFFH